MQPARRRGSRGSIEELDGGLADLQAQRRAAHLCDVSLHDMLVPRKRRGGESAPLDRTLAGMTAEERNSYLARLSPQQRAALLATLSPQERAALLAAMSPGDRAATLAAMSPEERLEAESGWDGDDRFLETMVTTGGLSRSERFKAARDGRGAYGGTRATLSMTLEQDVYRRPPQYNYPIDHPQAWVNPGVNARWPLDAKYLRWCERHGIDPHDPDHKDRMRFGFGIGPVTFPAPEAGRRASMSHLDWLASTKASLPPLRRREVEVVPVPVNPWEMEFEPNEAKARPASWCRRRFGAETTVC